MERSPDDVPMPLRFEPKAVVVFNVLHVWAFSWGWLVVLAPSFRNSGTQCTAPGLAFKGPSVGLLSTHLTAVRNHGTTRRGGSAAPHGPAWAREQAWPQLSFLSSTSFPVWRVVSPTPTHHRHDTGGLLLRVRQPRRFFGSLAFPRQRLPGQVFDAT